MLDIVETCILRSIVKINFNDTNTLLCAKRSRESHAILTELHFIHIGDTQNIHRRYTYIY